MTALRERRANDGWFRDERGGKSLGRVCLISWLLFSAGVVVADVGGARVSTDAYGFLGAIGIGLLTWVAGPRVGQHLSAAAAAFASRVPGGGTMIGGTSVTIEKPPDDSGAVG